MVQPMRARIAGRVTPTTNQSELGSLEMIEIPVKRNPNYIECCQVSGNLFVLSKRIIDIYRFQVRTHDISRMRFIDFEEMSVCLELTFSPIQLAACENYVACMSRDSMYMFKLGHREGNVEMTSSGEHDFNFGREWFEAITLQAFFWRFSSSGHYTFVAAISCLLVQVTSPPAAIGRL